MFHKSAIHVQIIKCWPGSFYPRAQFIHLLHAQQKAVIRLHTVCQVPYDFISILALPHAIEIRLNQYTLLCELGLELYANKQFMDFNSYVIAHL